MAIELPPLPYAKNALEPHISERTLDFHYGKHHQGYVTKTNKAIAGTKLDDANLEEIIAAADGDDQGLFNNAAQVWNHTFYWNSMAPNGGGAPSGDIASAIGDTFGGYDSFKEAFAAAGAGRFGSGWTWLIAKDGKLDVINTLNADTPLTDQSATPLLTMDVWEHAYYLDYQNGRGTYIDAILDNLVNWDFANANLKSA
ncbi:MAG: superoxide dismutase [Marinicaulis sp.]|nr:superoxide dismutase [Marinicaulis sp.]